MSHRTRRSIVILWSCLGLVAVLGSGPSGVAAQETGDLILGIEDVEPFARASSPHLRIAALEVDVARAERQSALAWSNPALAYDHEESDSYREWQFTLHKRIDGPLTRDRRHAAWAGRVRAAELRARQAVRDVVADLKTGYVRVRLIESRLDRLDRLAALVDLAADVAGSRHAEGELSGLDRGLIRLAAYTIATAENRSRSRYERALGAWRAAMGIEPSRRVTLTTPLAFQPIDAGGLAGCANEPASLPGDQAQVEMAQALEAQAEAARPGWLPGFDLYGGYKRFDPDPDGFVAGIALDLPLFGSGRGEAERLRAERRVVENALHVDRTRRAGEIAALIASVQAAQPLLARFVADLEPDSLADALLVSYREGALSLDELLGAVQIEAAAIEAHYAELESYYEDLFRLEALSGAELVHFTPQE